MEDIAAGTAQARPQNDAEATLAPPLTKEQAHFGFDAPARRHADTPLIIGHWSALGLRLDSAANVLAIDTGCLWGGSLTALRLEDRQVFQLPCQAFRKLG